MLLLTSTSDLVQVITDAASDIEVHASWVDNASGTITPGRTNTASITSATTTIIVASPGATTQRNVKYLNFHNNHASVSCLLRIVHTDGTTTEELIHATLTAGEALIFNENGTWTHYDNNGIQKSPVGHTFFNFSVAAQGPGFAADTYLTGSFIPFPVAPKVGTKYKCRFSVSKTGAGTATPIVQVRVGTAGSTGDASRCSFTFSAGTAAADVGVFEIYAVFRTVGSGTNAVLQGWCNLRSQPTTGFSSLLKAVQTTSGGFDSTVAALGIGVSVNGGTSAAWTVQLVTSEIENAA